MENRDTSDILLRLQGVKVVESPRVSRETIVDILREHTMMLSAIRQDLGSVMEDMLNINMMAADNKKTVVDFREDIEKIVTDFKRDATKSNDEMKKVLKLNTVFQKQMDVMNSRLDEFPVIRAEAKILQSNIETMSAKMLYQKDKFHEFENKSSSKCSELEVKSNNLQSKLNELRIYITKLTDDLVVPSNQVTVASSAGFSEKPMMLFEVLKTCHENISLLQNASASQGAAIAANSVAIDTKADESITFDVHNLSLQMKEVDETKKRDDEFGVGGIRRACEDLTQKFVVLQVEMHEKVNTRQMESAVRKKHELIVEYLKESMAATSDDENKFEMKIEEFRLAVQKLSNTKTDRNELGPLQEQVLRIQAGVHKINMQIREKEALGSSESGNITKSEAVFLLDKKVNKTEFNLQIESLLRSLKKNRKLAALSSGLADPVRDEAYDMNPIFSSTSIALLSKSAENTRRLSAPNRVPNVNPGTSRRSDFTLSNMEPQIGCVSYEIDALINTLSDDFLGDVNYTDKMQTRPFLGGRPATAAGVIKIEGGQTVTRPIIALRRPNSSGSGSGSSSSGPKHFFPHRVGAGAVDHETPPHTQGSGSGFTTRSHSPTHEGHFAPLRPNDPQAPDSDMSETMIKGNDGKFYFSDEVPYVDTSRRVELELSLNDSSVLLAPPLG